MSELQQLIAKVNEGRKACRLVMLKYRRMVSETTIHAPEIDTILIRQLKLRGAK